MALPVLGLSHCTGRSSARQEWAAFALWEDVCCWKAGGEGYNSPHFKIKLISATLKNLSCEGAPALRPFFSPRVNKGIALTLPKGPMRSCKHWVDLYDHSVFSRLCPLSMGKRSFPCLWLQPSTSKTCWSLWGKGHYISHTIMFSLSFEHFLWSLLRKNWPSQSNPPNRAAPWSLFVFFMLFLPLLNKLSFQTW